MRVHSTDEEHPSVFEGFIRPTENYFALPNSWTDICASINNLAELKILLYILRHTWGFQEYGVAKAMTIDELQHGRKRRDRTRMDNGTGLSKSSVIDGIKKAVTDGYLIYTIDATDRGRIKKCYALKMREEQANSANEENNGARQDSEYQQPGLPDDEESNTHSLGFEHPTSGNWTSHVNEIDSHGSDSGQRSEKDTPERHQRKDTPEIHQRKQVLASMQTDAQITCLPDKMDVSTSRSSTHLRRKPEGQTIDQEKREAIFDLFDTLLREVTGDPTAVYARNKDAAEHIDTLLKENQRNPVFVTLEKLRAVYLRMWHLPKDPRSGFYWREHMSIKVICKNYGAQTLALLSTQNQAQATPDNSYTFKSAFGW